MFPFEDSSGYFLSDMYIMLLLSVQRFDFSGQMVTIFVLKLGGVLFETLYLALIYELW